MTCLLVIIFHMMHVQAPKIYMVNNVDHYPSERFNGLSVGNSGCMTGGIVVISTDLFLQLEVEI